MTDTPKDRLGHIASNVGILAGLLEDDPAAVRELDDGELLALDTWTAGGNGVIRGECVRRAELGRRFTAYLASPPFTADELKTLSGFLRLARKGIEEENSMYLVSAAKFTGRPEFATALAKIDEAVTSSVLGEH
jgi:hypothetical protein